MLKAAKPKSDAMVGLLPCKNHIAIDSILQNPLG